MAAEPPITVDSLAKKMDDRKGVWWAVQSSKTASKHTTPHDQAATSAAEAWVKNPNPQTAAAAATAAKHANLHGPGTWAAQAAAWSAKPPAAGGAAPGAPGAPAAGAGAAPASVPTSLVPHAVAGSVKLSAALHAGAKLPELPKAPKVPAAPKSAPSGPKTPTAPTLKVPGLKMPAMKLAEPKIPGAPKEPAIPKAPALKVPTVPKNPSAAVEKAEMGKIHSPFIKMGIEIHAGKNLWA